MVRGSIAFAVASLLCATAAADGYNVGDPVAGFALKAVNPDVVGEKIVSIDDFYGAKATDPKKAIVLSFFATYCEPCKREMPFLAAMYDEYSTKGLSVMSVSIDSEKDKIDSLKTLADSSGVKFPVLSDRFNIVAKRYFVEKLPLVYIINGEGKIALVKTGYTDDATQTIFEEVRRLVGEPTSDPIPASIASHMPEGVAPTPPPEPAPVPEEVATADADADAKAAAEPAEEPMKKKRKKRRRKRRRKK
ncbi:MAG: TlpA disulfide reductase family protein [Myxococcota bacterium]